MPVATIPGVVLGLAVQRTDHALSDGKVFVCGWKNGGQLGERKAVARSPFVKALGISSAIVSAACTYSSSALRAGGMVFASGGNTIGELGVEDTVGRWQFD